METALISQRLEASRYENMEAEDMMRANRPVRSIGGAVVAPSDAAGAVPDAAESRSVGRVHRRLVIILASLNDARLRPADVAELCSVLTGGDRSLFAESLPGRDLEGQGRHDAGGGPSRSAAGDPGRGAEDGSLAGAIPEVENAVERLLDELVTAGQVARTAGGFVALSDDGTALLLADPAESRRKKALVLVTRAVIHLGRAVRVCDVAQYVMAHVPSMADEFHPLARMLARSLSSLRETGDLITVGMVRGPQSDGRILHLPSALEGRREEFSPKQPLSWLDYVADAVGTIWQDHIVVSGPDKPRPLTTKEVRVRLAADLGSDGRPVAISSWGVDLDHPMTVTLALQQLSKGRPAVRPVPGRTAVWVPADIPSSDIAIEAGYSSDTDRVIEATRRAMVRLGAPAVRAADVAEEVSFDEHLALASTQPIRKVLSDLAKVRTSVGVGSSSPRRFQRLHRVGYSHGSVLYCAIRQVGTECGGSPENDPDLLAARSFTTHGVVLRRAADVDAITRIAALARVRCPIIALGRARQLSGDLDNLLPEMESIADTGCEEVTALVGQLRQVREDAAGWERFRAARESDGLVGIEPLSCGIAPLELKELLAPVSETTAKFTDAGQVVRHYSRLIRRIPSPAFTNRRSGDPETARQYLFDRVDALRYGVSQWGGPQARLAASMAEDELGELRDARYVVRAIDTPILEQRLRALAALAFLQPTEAEAIFLRRARDDSSAGVREMSLWALGFARIPGSSEVVRDAAETDPDVQVRRVAQRLLHLGLLSGWQA